jgi:hypothetical protein
MPVRSESLVISEQGRVDILRRAAMKGITAGRRIDQQET